MQTRFHGLFLILGLVISQHAGAAEWDSQSSNFQIRTFRGGPNAQQLLEQCERLRLDLQQVWLSEADRRDWSPRCQVIVHATKASYQTAVGGGGAQTSGSSLVQASRGVIVNRRIDLLYDAKKGASALPHELTHIVLADRFEDGHPPRWLDEGIATMADSQEKRTLHHRDCHDALRSGDALRVVQLLRLEQFTSAKQVPAFYGQSLSLVHFLAEQDEPTKLIDFAEAAIERGYDRALRDIYQIEGIEELERRWRKYAWNTGARAPQSLVSFVR
ncbi:hypothetical protein LOC68_00685 [Blastopirellula sp. JC732]|uniref:Peptidase MA-like domain-containing protein n=1 Tax=Blastopirellula sediminis TaxID=2894196 RepID=A0A9X1MIR0_9BACT|nr:hypothetical protein [Blastopirellula sediminis]MCC9604390.1 hypothetical protein [Blastopirellula sediminis]MCC9626910.1 hypothetical protein [Blastopirellula sediminis]